MSIVLHKTGESVVLAHVAHHDDAHRWAKRRRTAGADELSAALDAPFENWAVFQHPSQIGIVDRQFFGPAQVMGCSEPTEPAAAQTISGNSGSLLKTRVDLVASSH